MEQLALQLHDQRELEVDNGLVYVTTGDFAGQIVFYDSDDEETDQAVCNIQVPHGHEPVEVLIPYNYLRPLTPEQYRYFVSDLQETPCQ